jgi:hypothetical protein
MEIKAELKKFLSKEGMVNGKSIILDTIDSLEKEYLTSLKTKANQDLENKMYNLHLKDLDIDVVYEDVSSDVSEKLDYAYRTSVFRVSDPVKPTIVGNWDRNITEDSTYRVNEVMGDFIVIRDDSGKLRPYLKSRFINTSPYLDNHN